MAGKRHRVVVVRRYVNWKGETVSYDLRVDGSDKTIWASEIGQYERGIVNAVIMSNGEVRAKPGKRIETVHEKLPAMPRQGKLRGGMVFSDAPDAYGMQFINACKRIRTCARQGILDVREDPHMRNNEHLFDMIRACGYTVEQFVQGYLCCLQPYALTQYEPRPDDLTKFDYWVLDSSYRYALLMKIGVPKQFAGVVVSFHESNVDNVSRPGMEDFNEKEYCIVLVDSANPCGDGFMVSYTVQHGFIRVNVLSRTKYYYDNGVSLVRYSDIHDAVLSTLSQFLLRLYETYSGIVNSMYGQLTKLSSVSFMANGFHTINSLCLCIDIYAANPDVQTKLILTTTIGEIIRGLTPAVRRSYYEALLKKYGTEYPNELYVDIMEVLKVRAVVKQEVKSETKLCFGAGV